MSPLRELERLRLLHSLRTRMGEVRHEHGAVAMLLRETARAFGAGRAALWALDPRGGVRRIWGQGEVADEPEVAAFLRHGEWPRPAPTRLLAPLQRRRRRWGAVVLDATTPFAAGDGRSLSGFAGVLAEWLDAFDRQRATEVRERIDRKITAQLRPQDLCYQILHGLRSLTGYDHSGSLYVREEGSGTLRLAAEQVAWSKRKSSRIGARVELGGEDLRAFARRGARALVRAAGGWEQAGAPVALLAAVDGFSGAPSAHSMLLAPLTDRHGAVLGVVRLAGLAAATLGDYEADLLARFVPQATIALGNAHAAESLRAAVARAEREHAMADLARGVAHDVNNALGAVLPIAQQLRAELRDGQVDLGTLRADIERIEAAMAVCRRVFAGMLAFAKGAAGRGARHGDLRRAVDNAAAILRVSAERRGVAMETDGALDLPPIAAPQHDLERLLLNLMSNACEAMAAGGTLTVEAAPRGAAAVDVTIRDEGQGMSPAQLARVGEAFYTTKTDGSGLGLAICRSIVSDIGGRMSIDSEVGKGTTVHVTLPVLHPEPERMR